MSTPAAEFGCHQARQCFSALQDKELPKDRQLLLEAHLEYCPACRAEYDRLEAVWEALGELPAPFAPAAFAGQVLERLEADRHCLNVLRLLPRFAPSVAVLGAMLLLGLATGGFLGHAVLPGQEALPLADSGSTLQTLDVFAPAPHGTLAHGYLQLAGLEGR
ncbi:MAG: zf-HC2 domain-containing protein [Humidesulfovibrio sp.]|nr:zf-HC2 domain-containing protein [Humidesulfovibrio sp.]